MAKKRWKVVKVPYGGGYSSLNVAKIKGTKHAPNALQKEFERQKIFIADSGIYSWNDAWIDISKPNHKNNVSEWEKIRKSTVDLSLDTYLTKDTSILFIGGSHSITAATFCGMPEFYKPHQVGLVVLDAHPDCCHKADWPIHSDWLRWLIEHYYVLPENILIIGLRQMEISEKEFLDNRNIKYFGVGSVAPHFFERFRKLKSNYLSIDIDVASGAYAPGTGCPSPGGFTDIELINLVKQLKADLPNLRAADIVEINPLNGWRKRILRYDITIDLGVKLIKEIIS